MSYSREAEVLVAGAGPVGLLAGLVLAEKGVSVQVIDEQPLTTARSYALALHPHSLELLDDLGLAKPLLEKGRPVDAVAFYQGAERRCELRYSQVSKRFPYLLVVPQHALEDLLESRLKARSVPVLWNHRLASLALDSSGANATVQRLAPQATGYGVATTEWAVEKEWRSRAAFVVGADGHRSLVRRALDIPFEAAGPTQLFAVFELIAQGAALDEVRVIFDGATSSVLWPLGEDRIRFSFELDDQGREVVDREKGRAVVLLGDASYQLLDRELLQQLVAQRAPWFQGALGEVAWSLAVRFERRLAREFGRGRAWLAGDAAHLAPPIGVQSMNTGLAEAVDLGTRIHAALRGGSATALDEYGQRWRTLWQRTLRDEAMGFRPTSQASEFVRAHARQIIEATPAALSELAVLAPTIGLNA